MIRPGFPGDPIAAYGQRASEMLLSTIPRVPSGFRQIALEAVLNETEPGLADKVARRARTYMRKSGVGTKRALKMALASSMSEGLAKEMLALGQGRKPAVRSQLGLGYYGSEAALDGLWGSIKDGVSKVGSAIKGAATKVGSTVASGASTAFDWGKTAINKLGSLACGVMNHPAAGVAAGAAGAATGAPPQAGMAAVQVGSQICTRNDTPAVSPAALMQPQRGMPGWVLPVAIGGAGLVTVLLLTRK